MTSSSLSAPRGATSALSNLDESGVLRAGLAIVEAENATVTLLDGDGTTRAYTDLISAFATVNFGHRNPGIKVDLNGPDIAAYFYPPEAETVAGWLTARLHLPGHRVLFQVGGSFAVSTALALAQHRKPGSVVAVEGGYHGLGADALAVGTVQGDDAIQVTTWSAPGGRVTILPQGETPDWNGVSALLYEPVQGANGYIALDPGWLVELESGARDAGVTVVADEIQSGFYRHGFLSVARHFGLEPDILLFSKSLTNGVYPLSAVVYDAERLGRDIPTPRLAHTYQMGALGYRAAAAVGRWLDAAPVDELVAGVNKRLADAGAEIAAIEGVHGLEVNGATLSFQPGAPGVARAIALRLFDAGVLVFTGGLRGERMRVAPPLTIPLGQLEESLTVLTGAVGVETAAR
jgi:4-aminobutyrate aminotransferase-like enzyme